jgi:uncharacterized damage-inducible protein DinB
MNETPQQYTERVVSLTKGQEPLRVQRSTAKKLAAAIKGLNKRQLTKRPAPDKWSIGEILAHLADAEVAGSWRLRLILGKNSTPIEAFDQDVWAKTFNYQKRDPRQSLETFRALRENNLLLLKSVSKELWENYGMHSERGKETISHVVRMFAGHDVNHLRQIEAIARQARGK